MLLHGWGMNHAVWHHVARELAMHYRVHSVDLPGYGESKLLPDSYTLENIAEQLADVLANRVSAPVYLVGWSLGGMLAVQLAADHAQRVKGLVLLASNLSFIRRPDWSCAMEEEVLQGFAHNLQQDHKSTVQRFLSLQVMGDANGRQTLRELKQSVLQCNEPSFEALQGGLQILQTADLRDAAALITQPVLLLAGDRDRLVPPAALEANVNYFLHGQSHMIENAGHAPFISRQSQVLALIKDFISHA